MKMHELKTLRASPPHLRRRGPAPRALCLECIAAWETGEIRKCERCSSPEPGRCNGSCWCTDIRRRHGVDLPLREDWNMRTSDDTAAIGRADEERGTMTRSDGQESDRVVVVPKVGAGPMEAHAAYHCTMHGRQVAVIFITGDKCPLCEAYDEVRTLRAALVAAAESLRTLSRSGARDATIKDLVDVRGYANSRARVAFEALVIQEKTDVDD